MPATHELLDLDEAIAHRYPREAGLPGDCTITITPLVPSDWQMLEVFLQAVPALEHRFFRRDLADPDRVRRWCSQLDYHHMLPLLAWDGDRIAADGALQREPGLWSAHVGKLRLLVHPDYRRQGIGTALVHELVEVARRLGLHKVVHECASEQMHLIWLLGRMGFANAAVLREFIRDRDGKLHDMVVMELNLSKTV